MRRSLYLATVVLALTWAISVRGTFTAKADSGERHVFPVDNIPWGPAPNFIPPGAQLAVLEGNPLAPSGDYTIRLKMPDGYRIAPHFHPQRENVTIISGTFKIGMGDRFEESKMLALNAGSFGFLDPSMHHYAKACGEVVVQIHGPVAGAVQLRQPRRRPQQKVKELRGVLNGCPHPNLAAVWRDSDGNLD